MKIWRAAVFCLYALLFFDLSVFAYSNLDADSDYIFTLKDNDGIMLAGVDENVEVVSDRLNIYKADADTIERLEEFGMIEYAEKDYDIWLDSAENTSIYNDPLFNTQWYFEKHNLEYAKKHLGTGEGVRVAILDSGVTLHPDFNLNKIEKGYNYKAPDKTGNEISSNDTIGNQNHGTQVAGIICAQSNNELGVAGIAEDVTIVPLVVYRDGKGQVSDVIAAIEDAVSLYECDVINMSLSSSPNENDSKLLQKAVDFADENNVILVAAVGNDGKTGKKYPASCENVIGVGSVNSDIKVSYFSQRNDSVDIAAAGEGLTLPDSKGEYASGLDGTGLRGTSFSAPIISGFAALLKGKYPDIDNELFLKILKAGSADIDALGYDVYTGYGLFDAKESVRFLEEVYDFFISPVYKTNSEMCIKVFGDIAEGCLNFAVYDEKGRLKYIDITDLKTQDGLFYKKYDYNLEEGEKIKIFAFDSLENMRPLGNSRVIQY